MNYMTAYWMRRHNLQKATVERLRNRMDMLSFTPDYKQVTQRLLDGTSWMFNRWNSDTSLAMHEHELHIDTILNVAMFNMNTSMVYKWMRQQGFMTDYQFSDIGKYKGIWQYSGHNSAPYRPRFKVATDANTMSDHTDTSEAERGPPDAAFMGPDDTE